MRDEAVTIGENIINDVLGNIAYDCSNDTLEDNFGLLSALKEISGMAPAPASMDWSISNACSFFNEEDKDGKENLQQELRNSVMSSTPRISNQKEAKIKIGRQRLESSFRRRASSLPLHDLVVLHEGSSDEECSELDKSSDVVVQDLTRDIPDTMDRGKEIKLKIDKTITSESELLTQQNSSKTKKDF